MLVTTVDEHLATLRRWTTGRKTKDQEIIDAIEWSLGQLAELGRLRAEARAAAAETERLQRRLAAGSVAAETVALTFTCPACYDLQAGEGALCRVVELGKPTGDRRAIKVECTDPACGRQHIITVLHAPLPAAPSKRAAA